MLKKFLKTIVTDILTIPVIFEIGYKINKGIDLENDKNLSPYAKWVSNLLDTDSETPSNEVEGGVVEEV